MKLINLLFGRNIVLYIIISSVLCFTLRCIELHNAKINKKSSTNSSSSSFSDVIKGDGLDYLIIANTIKEHGVIGREKYADSTLGAFDVLAYFNMKDKPATVSTGSQAFRPPVWPIILSGMLLLSHDNLITLYLFRFMIDVLSIIIFSLLINKLEFKKETKNIAILFFSLNPVWLYYSVTLLSEPITMFFVMLFSLILINILQKNQWKIPELLLCGLIGGIIILSHPYYSLFVVFAGIGLLLLNKKRYLKVIIFYLAVAIPPGIWIVRNQNAYHTNKIFLSLNGVIYAKSWNSTTATQYNNKSVGASDEAVDVPKYYPGLNLSTLSEMDYYEVLKNTGKSFIRDNMKLIPRILFRKLICNLDPHPERHEGGIMPLLNTVYRTLALFSLIVVLIFIKRVDKNFLILFIPLVLSYIFTGLIFLSEFRFQLPKLSLETISIFFAIQQISLWVQFKRKPVSS